MNPLKLPKKLIEHYRYSKTTARDPRHNDVYIVEYPKSGVTWLSTMLGNTALISSGRKEEVSFASSGLYVPDIHVTRDIADVAYTSPPVRFVKSHAEFNPNYVFVIYLVRHPFDVMKSFFRFNKDIGGSGKASFYEFCKSEDMGVPAWKRHVSSWLTGNVIAQRVHLCRYEDLLKDAVHELDMINQNFGWNVERHSIELAVSKSTVNAMKESESVYRSNNPRYNMTFVRGAQQTFQVEGEVVSYIEEECEKELQLLGYK